MDGSIDRLSDKWMTEALRLMEQVSSQLKALTSGNSSLSANGTNHKIESRRRQMVQVLSEVTGNGKSDEKSDEDIDSVAHALAAVTSEPAELDAETVNETFSILSTLIDDVSVNQNSELIDRIRGPLSASISNAMLWKPSSGSMANEHVAMGKKMLNLIVAKDLSCRQPAEPNLVTLHAVIHVTCLCWRLLWTASRARGLLSIV